MNFIKKYFLAVALLLCFAPSASAAEISVTNVTIPKGGTALMEVFLTNPDVECTGFQFIVNLPQGITPVLDSNNKYILEKGSRISSLLVTIGMSNKGNNTYQFLAYQGEALPVAFPGTEGQVLTILLQADENLNTGDVLNASLSTVYMFDTSARSHDLDNVNFNITIGEETPKTILDETSTTIPEASSGNVDIIVRRTINANEWSTICLPFAMTEEQTKAAFGNDVQICNYVDHETEEDEYGNITAIIVNFEDADLATYGFEANLPYIIKTSSKIEQFECNATIEPDEDNAIVEYDNGRTGSRRVVYGTFYGTLHANVTIPNNNLFLNSNKFYYSKGKTKIKAFRGYFDLVDILSSVEGAGVKLRVTVNDETTDITEIEGQVITGDVYSLQGIYLGNSTENLPKGIYIVNGKKIMIK